MSELILLMCLNMGGLDCNLALSVAKIESNLNPSAIGASHNELGLFQLRPEFHKCADLNPKKNIECGLLYLKKLKRNFYATHGPCYVTYYNVGPNSGIKYPCLHKYYKKVTKVYKNYTDKYTMNNIPEKNLNDYKLAEQYYLSDQDNVARSIVDTFLTLYEIEVIVGRFNKNSQWAGQLKGQVLIYLDGRREIRHHFNKKLLWTNKGETNE